MTMEALLDFPIWQCTKTLHYLRFSRMNWWAWSKYSSSFTFSSSFAFIHKCCKLCFSTVRGIWCLAYYF